MSEQTTNKRIAKNTIFLYIRMFLIMGVSLYTSRVILQALGVEDYGIYNVVAGVVSMFTVINSALTNASQRFITFSIGKDNDDEINKVFSSSILIHVIISLLFFIAAETFGLWLLNTKMVIPSDRMFEANIVFQMAILSTILLIMSTPYNALIIAEERMSAFAYISILDVSVKLLIVYLLYISSFDKLITYAVLMFLSQLLIRQIYWFYCRRNFSVSKFRMIIDKNLLKKMTSFSCWSLFGNLASVCADHGVNIVLNIYFGPAVNAARGIANQVMNAVLGFTANLQMAINPQITKNYAIGDLSRTHFLIFVGAKFSFFLTLLLTFPIIWSADTILHIWLGIVPDYTVSFVQIILFNIVLGTLTAPFQTAAQANGDIKLYQALVGGILLLILPLTYFGLKFLPDPLFAYWINLGVSILAQIARCIMMRKMIDLHFVEYMKRVIFPSMMVLTLSSILPVYLYSKLDSSTTSFIIKSLASISCIIVAIYSFGLTKSEKKYVHQIGKKLMNRRNLSVGQN